MGGRFVGDEPGLVAYFPMDSLSAPFHNGARRASAVDDVVGGLQGVASTQRKAYAGVGAVQVHAPLAMGAEGASAEELLLAPVYPGAGDMGTAGMALVLNGVDLALEAPLPSPMPKSATVELWFQTGVNTQDDMALLSLAADVYVSWHKV